MYHTTVNTAHRFIGQVSKNRAGIFSGFSPKTPLSGFASDSGV